jgi:hypothetical protein
MLEKNVFSLMIPAQVIPANTSTLIYDPTAPIQGTTIEYAAIELFNAGANNFYYAYGNTCDNKTNFCAFVVPGQMLEVGVREQISVFSVGGTTISFTILKRDDMVQPAKNIL